MRNFKHFLRYTRMEAAPKGRAWVGGSADGWRGTWVWVDGSFIEQLPWLYYQRSGGVGGGGGIGDGGTQLSVDKD
ncbi:hypothetical protein Pcinc_022471, partial [Petrolisthes cinctipes]